MILCTTPQVAGCMASKFRNAGQTCVSTNRFDCGLIIGLGLGFDLGFSTGLILGLVAHSHLCQGSWSTRLCMMPLLQKLRLELI